MQHTINTIESEGQLWISGRSLFAFMDISGTQGCVGFFRHRIKMLKLESDKDYIELPHWREHDKAHQLIEFRFTLEAAIKLAEYSKSGKTLTYLVALQKAPITGNIDTNDQTLAPKQDTLTVSNGLFPLLKSSYSDKPKSRLQEAMAKLAEIAQEDTDEEVKERLETIEGKLDIILTFFKSAADALFSAPATANSDTYEDIELVPARIDMRHGTMRDQILGLVNDYVALNPQVTHHQVWRKLYGILRSEFGYDAWRFKNPKDPSYLESVERNGQLENMFKVATLALLDYKKPAESKLKATVNLTQQPAEALN